MNWYFWWSDQPKAQFVPASQIDADRDNIRDKWPNEIVVDMPCIMFGFEYGRAWLYIREDLLDKP